MSFRLLAWRAAFSAVAVSLALAGCGGGDDVRTPTAASQPPATVAAIRAGVSPFIAFVDLELPDGGQAPVTVHWRIAQKPGSFSKPVDARYAMAYLQRRGYSGGPDGRLTVPVFGLYANHLNQVDVELQYADGSVQALQTGVQTTPYVDPNGIYDRPRFVKARAAGEALDFDFFYMRSTLGSPVIVDSDGEVRWVLPGTSNSFSSLFNGNGFVVGDVLSPSLHRLELDGTTSSFPLQMPGATDFHHSMDVGKQGVLVEVDTSVNGVANLETTLADIDLATGVVFKQWDLADSFSRLMRSRGDDPSSFVRPGVDWFHMNAATYDARDDTLIVSSRENFVVKIDYATGDVVWILGDPTKYWHDFPSLVASSLTLGAGGLYPIGQHSVSIRHDGSLLLFNDGFASFEQPAGKPAGENRTYSAVSAYAIDAASRSAQETWRFDYGQSILSIVCSSAYEADTGTSVLVSYSEANGPTRARLVGLDPNRSVVFDFEYPTSGCGTSWSAKPIALEALDFQ